MRAFRVRASLPLACPVRWGHGVAEEAQALELFHGLPSRYDQLSAALSFWQDPRWRRALVDAVAPQAGERILDVATGTGMVAAELLRRADCTVVGLDQSPEMLAAARARFAGDGRARGAVEGQAEELPFAEASFDALTFTYLLRYVDDPPATMRELARVVRPGGRVASLEFGVPPRRVAARGLAASTRRSGCRCSGASPRASGPRSGRFLGPSISGFYAKHPLERIVGYWRDAGLSEVRVRRMSLGGGVVMSARQARHAPVSARRSDARGGAARGDVLLVLPALAANLDRDVDEDDVDEQADPAERGDQADVLGDGLAGGEDHRASPSSEA